MKQELFTVGNNDCVVSVVDGKLRVSFDNGYTVNLAAEDDILDLPISESDLELMKDVVYNNESFSWGFPTHNGINILVNFVTEKEDE